MVAGPDLSVELQPALRAVGAGVPADRAGPGPVGVGPQTEGPQGSQRVVGSRWAAGPHRADPGRRRGVHPGQRAFAGAVLDSAGRRFHARPGAAGPAAVSARTGGGGAGGVPRGHQAVPRGRLLVGRRGERAVDGGRGLVAVGRQFARDGRRRHPRHLLGDRRRAPLLRAGNGPRAPADGCRLPGLPPDARGAGGVEQHPGGRAATAVRQLRPVGLWSRPARTDGRRPPRRRHPKRGRTQCFSPTSAWWG